MRYVVAVLLLVALAAGFVFEYEPLRVNYRAAAAYEQLYLEAFRIRRGHEFKG